jgi:hypothetical protein
MSIITQTANSQNLPNVLPDTGFVGVGTTTPSCNFQVIGQSQISGSLTIDSSITIADSANVNNNLRVNGHLFVAKNTYISDSVFASHFNISQLHIADSLKVGTNSIWIGGIDQNTGLNNHIYSDNGYLLLQSQADQFLYQHSPQRNVITNLNSGRMGIGTVNPQTKLHVKGVQCIDCGGPPPSETTFITIEDEIKNSGGQVTHNTKWQMAATAPQDRFFINKPGMPTNIFTITADSKIGMGTHTPGINYESPANLRLDVNGDARFYRNNNPNNYVRVAYNGANGMIDSYGDGNLLINYYSGKEIYMGTGNTKADVHMGKNLFVCGTVKSKEWIVEVGWCDYVFDEDYKRMSFLEKAEYYKQYKHLPKIQSGKEIEQNGLKVAETMLGFVYNLETLSLDQIELYKMIQDLKKENEELKKILQEIHIKIILCKVVSILFY